MGIAKARSAILFPTFFLISNCCDCQPPVEEKVIFDASYCETGVKEFNVVFLQPINPKFSKDENEINSRLLFEKWRTLFRLEPLHTWPNVNFYSKDELKCSDLHPTDQGRIATMLVWTSENGDRGVPLPLEKGGKLSLRISFWSDFPSAAQCVQKVVPKHLRKDNPQEDTLKREYMNHLGAGDYYGGVTIDYKDNSKEKILQQIFGDIARQSSGYYASNCNNPFDAQKNPINKSIEHVRFR